MQAYDRNEPISPRWARIGLSGIDRPGRSLSGDHTRAGSNQRLTRRWGPGQQEQPAPRERPVQLPPERRYPSNHHCSRRRCSHHCSRGSDRGNACDHGNGRGNDRGNACDRDNVRGNHRSRHHNRHRRSHRPSRRNRCNHDGRRLPSSRRPTGRFRPPRKKSRGPILTCDSSKNPPSKVPKRKGP